MILVLGQPWNLGNGHMERKPGIHSKRGEGSLLLQWLQLMCGRTPAKLSASERDSEGMAAQLAVRYLACPCAGLHIHTPAHVLVQAPVGT